MRLPRSGFVQNGLLGSWLDWHREVGQFQDQMRGKMHGSMVVFGINPTELSGLFLANY